MQGCWCSSGDLTEDIPTMPGLLVFSKLPPGTVGMGVEPTAGVDGGVHTGIVQHVGSRGSGCSVHRSWSRPKNVGHLQYIYNMRV